VGVGWGGQAPPAGGGGGGFGGGLWWGFVGGGGGGAFSAAGCLWSEFCVQHNVCLFSCSPLQIPKILDRLS